MRIWDIDHEKLCRNHLLGEHRELHAIWSILTRNKKGYLHHPETERWKGKLRALFLRHEALIAEILKRGYRHQSPLEKKMAKGSSVQDAFVNDPGEQVTILKQKKCSCRI